MFLLTKYGLYKLMEVLPYVNGGGLNQTYYSRDNQPNIDKIESKALYICRRVVLFSYEDNYNKNLFKIIHDKPHTIHELFNDNILDSDENQESLLKRCARETIDNKYEFILNRK